MGSALSDPPGGNAVPGEAVAAFLLAVDQVAGALREGGEHALRVLDAVPPAHVRVLADQLTRIAERFEGDRVEARPDARGADGPGAN